MKLLQLIKDFRKWRKEKYEKKCDEIIEDITWNTLIEIRKGKKPISIPIFGEIMLKYGINHRKEILKKVKI